MKVNKNIETSRQEELTESQLKNIEKDKSRFEFWKILGLEMKNKAEEKKLSEGDVLLDIAFLCQLMHGKRMQKKADEAGHVIRDDYDGNELFNIKFLGVQMELTADKLKRLKELANIIHDGIYTDEYPDHLVSPSRDSL